MLRETPAVCPPRLSLLRLHLPPHHHTTYHQQAAPSAMVQLLLRAGGARLRAVQADPADTVAAAAGLDQCPPAAAAALVRQGGSCGAAAHRSPPPSGPPAARADSPRPLPSPSPLYPQRIVYAGRTLDPAATLTSCHVLPGGTLEVVPRLAGGGGDGGATGAESRSCYLEMYAGKKKDKVR